MSYTVTAPSLPLNLNSSLTSLKTDRERGQNQFLEPPNPSFKWRLLIAYDGTRYSGGELPDLDSVEGALQWRERAWSRRLIQQTLGDISAVLKAFVDYVDSLCGTPYPIDYDIWLRRLRKHMRDDDHGKGIDMS